MLAAAAWVAACASDSQTIGDFRIVTATDGLFGLRCQPRTEFFFIDREIPESEPLYLGTCSTPRFVTGQLDMPGNPSCFAVSADGGALVYFHRPNWCGAGERARSKPGGVYRYTRPGGDALLYSDAEVGQIWSRDSTDPHSIRVSRGSATAQDESDRCRGHLIIPARPRASAAPEPPPGEC